MPLKSRCKIPRDSVSDFCRGESRMTQHPGTKNPPESPIRNIQDFLDKCGMSKLTGADRVIGEVEAMVMVSNFRNTDIDEIDASDRAVRFLQGKQLQTIWRSVSREALFLTMSDADSNKSDFPTAQTPDETDYLPRLNAFLHSQPVLHSDCDEDDDVVDNNSKDKSTPPQVETIQSPDDKKDPSPECNVEEKFELFKTTPRTPRTFFPPSKNTRVIAPVAVQPQPDILINLDKDETSQTEETPSELYSFFEEAHYNSDYESSISHHPFLSFGYMSAGFDSDSEAMTPRFGVAAARTRRVIKPSQELFDRVVLKDSLSSDHLLLSPPRGTTSSAFSRAGMFAPTGTRAVTRLVKAHSSHELVCGSGRRRGRSDDRQLASPPDPLLARFGTLHLTVPDHTTAVVDNETRLDSLMSNTSYVLYDSDDTPPPPDCNIAPELFVQSNRSLWRN